MLFLVFIIALFSGHLCGRGCNSQKRTSLVFFAKLTHHHHQHHFHRWRGVGRCHCRCREMHLKKNQNVSHKPVPHFIRQQHDGGGDDAVMLSSTRLDQKLPGFRSTSLTRAKHDPTKVQQKRPSRGHRTKNLTITMLFS